MRILVATRIYAPEAGAAAYRLAATVRALRRAGHDVEVLTTRVPGTPGSADGISRWPVLRDRSGAVRGYVQYASFDIPLIFRLLARRRFDAVLVEPPPTTGAAVALACALRRRPYIYFAADVTSNAAAGIGVHPLVVAVLRAAEKRILARAAAVLSISAGVSAAVRELTAGRARVAEVGTGIDTGTFSRSGPAAPAGPVFVYAGTMSEIQGAGVFVDAFLQIMHRVPQARLQMYGQGVELPALRRRAAAAGDRIRFMGVAGGAEIARVLRGAAAGLASVRPGRGYDFAFATKALVSLSCGTPVIYAGVGPLRTLVAEHGLGHSVDWDAGQVAEAMLAVLRQPAGEAERERLAQWVQANYSLDSVGSRAAAAIGSAAGQAPPAG
ncbi:glycosyltransferase [Arthrobacter mobilis]|uniref:D-inositol 3-phosphate glycosyltransferase n=1 Tax=Arthrobacter mobilis TaxID=2724944 RepID=A0A7X6K330_9MICC|nr:glycosyltransferase [Arthrobacter mobilis]NKX53842.1 glycosyltransferase family 4 protein [Arthrobacter mobilis]